MQVRNPESGQWRRIVEAARLESTPPQMFISLDDDSGHLIGIHETVMTREAIRASDGE
ncbi:hypothetical protein K1T35_48295 (plasmid) [Pseudonocardia sp. DSM 110487]|uniref:hypothetical protein n=1 Tax=Pseudonocardia sp. DSM 110487 TaxID=2865833 RepID=UPI001C6971C3|nr:hypothetical protein [Pseudonocardia sp. DSM 110487]QYN41150.1 hypothetical protein K1T35_48295 [Pseudonocardia sp. DSM 110487]